MFFMSPAGFMVSRMLGVAPTIADAIIDQLAKPADKATAAGGCSNAVKSNGASHSSSCSVILWLPGRSGTTWFAAMALQL